MSDPASIAREYLEAFNRRDWDQFKGILASEYSYTGGDGEKLEGPEAGLAVGQMFATAMSDAKINIQRVHVAGDTAIVEFQASGTHDGDFMGIAATGRKVTMLVVTVLEIKDGKITAEREYMDMAHVMQQIGAMPEPAHS
ncbi:MAG: ester cyclase [Chloroflexi bacterium]|nr:ester cyclase [Chloroflexota bacterium]